MAYLAIAIIVFVMHIAYRSTDSKNYRKYIWIFTCAIVFLFVGLRSYYTGNDTKGYVDNFLFYRNYAYADIKLFVDKDLGYYFLVKTIGLFTASPTVFLLSTSFVSLIGVFATAYRYSDYPILVLFFYITLGNFLFVFSGIRQAIAMSICLLSLPYIEKRKPVLLTLVVLLAASIHHSATIFLPNFFLARRRINYSNLTLTIVVTVVAYFFYDRLLEAANDILGYRYGVEELDNGLVMYFVLVIILVFAYLNRDRWITNDKQLIAMNMAIICAVIWTFRLIGRTAERPSLYWLNMIPVVLTNSLESFERRKGKKKVIIFAIITVLLSLALFIKRVSGVYYGFIS